MNTFTMYSFFVALCIIISIKCQQEEQYEEDFVFNPLKTSYCEQQGDGYCDLANLYVTTVMKSVCGYLLETPNFGYLSKQKEKTPGQFNEKLRLNGRDHPLFGVTMVGWKRLVNINHQLLRLINEDIEGDFLEAGVWRGGSSITARAILKVYDTPNKRKVHVVDSFQGLPFPRESFLKKDRHNYHLIEHLKISLETVQSNFKRYGLLDDQVIFHKGYFNESLTKFRKENPNAKIAFLRLDGDMYESTTDILYNTYDFVPVGGTVVIDDWSLDFCRKAVIDFFKHHQVEIENMLPIERARFFIKSKEFKVDYQYYLDNFFKK